MTRLRIGLIAGMILIAGFISIGIFNPTSTVSTSFHVSRSAATTFRVLTAASNVGSFFVDASSIETQVEGDEKAGNQYRVTYPEDGQVTSVELVGFQDLKQFAFQSKSDSKTTLTTYSLVRDANGTQVNISHVISPSSWWGRSIQSLILGSQIARQDRINSKLSQLVEASPESLIGDWVAVSDWVEEQLFTFRSDGTADWKVSVEGQVFPLTNIYWVRESSVFPEPLDLSGFTNGPLRGLTLFGIVDMSRRDTLIFDAEAGPEYDDRVRPASFSESAVTYIRIR